MRKLGYEPAPLVLAFVLGPMLENNLQEVADPVGMAASASSSERSRSH